MKYYRLILAPKEDVRERIGPGNVLTSYFPNWKWRQPTTMSNDQQAIKPVFAAHILIKIWRKSLLTLRRRLVSMHIFIDFDRCRIIINLHIHWSCSEKKEIRSKPFIACFLFANWQKFCFHPKKRNCHRNWISLVWESRRHF